jgi:AcrR family transcriptional regulator
MTETDRPLRADARRNRARVLAVAQEVFETEGLAVPVEEVARRAGVGVGTVYRHFPTKEALFEAIMLAAGVNSAAAEIGIADRVSVIGRPSCMVFTTKDTEGNPSQPFRTLFLQELLRRGVLGQSFVISAAHTDAEIEHTIEAAREAMLVYRKALDAGGVDGLLAGRPVAPALRRYAEPRRLPAIRAARKE